MSTPNSPITIARSTLQIVFDTAVNSMDFGSGFLDNDEVSALRACAASLGVDKGLATPSGFHEQYYGHRYHPGGHDWHETGHPVRGKCCEHGPYG